MVFEDIDLGSLKCDNLRKMLASFENGLSVASLLRPDGENSVFFPIYVGIS